MSYIGRDYGTFNGLTLQTKTITGQTVLTNYGWADGTDSNWAYTHYQSYFKFTLQQAATITLSVTSTNPSNFLPAFSIYRGLGSTSPPDQDEEGPTVTYLQTLSGPAREGAFDALHTWKMGNENDQSFDEFSVFTYMGHAADGTSANFGPTPEIWGDGVADGTVIRSFTLAAGTYTVVIGGASYFNQVDSNVHGFTTTLSVPEPSSAWLFLGGLPFLGAMRIRSKAAGVRHS